jgi:hypothetical protein
MVVLTPALGSPRAISVPWLRRRRVRDLDLAGVVTVARLSGRGPGFHGFMAGGRRDRARALLCGKIA